MCLHKLAFNKESVQHKNSVARRSNPKSKNGTFVLKEHNYKYKTGGGFR